MDLAVALRAVLTGSLAVSFKTPYPTETPQLDYQRVFNQAIDRLHAEGRYRVFIDILRNKGNYPNARCFARS